MSGTPRRTLDEIAQEEIFLLGLRRNGMPYREMVPVAERKWPKRAFSHDLCHRRVIGALRNAAKESADEMIALEQQRLDHYLDVLADKVEDGDTQAVLASLNVSRERRRLLGLDMPTKVEHSGEITTVPFEEKQKQLAELLGLDDPTLPTIPSQLARA